MACMHELVHVCHLCCPFFGNSPDAKSYPSIFIFGAAAQAPGWQERLILYIENCPKAIKMDKKFFRKIFLEMKIIFKINFVEWTICWLGFFRTP